LMKYDTIASDLKSLLERYAPSSSTSGIDAFVRLGGEPFWETSTSIVSEAATARPSASDRRNNIQGGFTESVHQLLRDNLNATAMRALILERWIEPEYSSSVASATE